jgi:uncharacterized protein (DUF2126 family)
VKLSGLTTDSRYAVTCNGRRVSLHPTEVSGEAVAGVRYRARRLSAALHPTIPVHAPLVFDVIDLWKERSVGRCTYHVGPPDGGIYTARPLNASEAEERRKARFQVEGTSTASIAAPEAELNPIFPMTLDLRMQTPARKSNIESTGLTP